MAASNKMTRRNFLKKASRKAAPVVIALAGATAGSLGAIKIRRWRLAKLAVKRTKLIEAIKSRMPGLEKQQAWVDISLACRWMPENLPVEKIRLVAKVSEATKIPAERVAYTISVNPDLDLRAWRTRLRVKEAELVKAKIDSNKSGLAGRNARAQLKTLPGVINQAKIVSGVIEALLSENPGLAGALGKDLNNPLISANLKALVEKK